MIFSSLLFLFAFLPVTLALYYLIPGRRARNWVLFVLSLIFYGWGEPVYILVMLASITEAWGFGFLIAKHREGNKRLARTWMAVSLLCNLAALLFFKYANFFIDNLRLIPLLSERLSPIEGLTLPIGISFYTFQIMSYTIDLYRGETDVQRNFVAFGAYVTLFPQLIAGPIVRYRDVDDQLTDRRENLPLFSSGVRRFLIGLGKKVLIGDACSRVYEYAKGTAQFHPTAAAAWMTVIFYTLHIYYDFSGYSDMAIGIGRMLGFDFPENFLHPYAATSVRDFWRRWHVSLSTWFRDYLYIPLGGNRKGLPRTCLNSLIVFALCGLWHGASAMFLLWGLWHGLFLTLERLAQSHAARPGKSPDGPGKSPDGRAVLGHLYATAVFLFGWLLFRCETLSSLRVFLRSLFGAAPTAAARSLFIDVSPKFLLALLFGLLFAYGRPAAKGGAGATPPSLPATLLSDLLLTLLALLALFLLVGGGYNPFLYFRF